MQFSSMTTGLRLRCNTSTAQEQSLSPSLQNRTWVRISMRFPHQPSVGSKNAPNVGLGRYAKVKQTVRLLQPSRKVRIEQNHILTNARGGKIFTPRFACSFHLIPLFSSSTTNTIGGVDLIKLKSSFSLASLMNAIGIASHKY